MTDPDLLFTAKIRNLTENELVVFFVCSVFYQIRQGGQKVGYNPLAGRALPRDSAFNNVA